MPLVAPPTPEMLQRFGVGALRPGQKLAFDALAEGRDVLVVLPTGGGKSLCYQLPAACGASPAVVVSPLVALMKDQVDALRRRGIAAAQLSSAVSATERDEAWRRLDSGVLQLLYLAPEALASPATIERLAAARPRLLAIDEAHCISEWGESFRPSYLALGTMRRALGGPTTIALTATATPRTARDIVARLALRDPVIVSGGFDRANLRLAVRRVATDGERAATLLALGTGARGATIVYSDTRRGTERLAAAFVRAGVRAAPFHAGLPTSERAILQDRFQSNRIRLIVATNAFGMGVDKPDVRLVVHATPPLTLEAYYQEAGRGGRDGGIADCILLVAPGDLARAASRIAATRVSEELLRSVAELLAAPGSALGGSESFVASEMSRRLSVAPRDTAAAIRLLSEEGLLAPSSGRGAFRVLATESRLRSGHGLPRRDADALLTYLATATTLSRSQDGLSLRDLASIAPDGDARAWIRQLEAHQLACWRLLEPPWTLRTIPPSGLLARLAERHRLRQARDLWRHRQVARMVTSSRCRRLVLLRYFGDSGPAGACGACDCCGFAA